MPILAVLALAKFSALQAGTIAFTIFFSAHGLFTRTLSNWSHCRDTLEVVGVPQIGKHLGPINLFLVALLVTAARANTVPTAFSTIREALTVQFQAPDFGTLAAVVSLSCFLMEIICGLHLHFLYFGRALGVRPL